MIIFSICVILLLTYLLTEHILKLKRQRTYGVSFPNYFHDEEVTNGYFKVIINDLISKNINKNLILKFSKIIYLSNPKPHLIDSHDTLKLIFNTSYDKWVFGLSGGNLKFKNQDVEYLCGMM